MSFYEMEPNPVYASGVAVSGETATAQELGSQYLNALSDTTEWVRHPTVIGALERYYFVSVDQVRGVATDIENLAHGTSGSAVVIADADDESTSILSVPAALAFTANGELDEPITAS